MTAERHDLLEMAERRQAEIDRLQAEWKTMSDQLIEANRAKCEAQVGAEDVVSREAALAFKEKRMTEEREYLTAQIGALQTELTRKNEEVLRVRTEQTHRVAELQAQLASKNEGMSMLEGKEEALRADVASLQGRCEALAEKLKAARESEALVEENYRQELKAQTNLANLYKGKAF